MGGSSGGGTSRSTQNVTSTVTQSDLPKEFYPYLQKQMQMADALPVSYTHLTLPTIYSV